MEDHPGTSIQETDDGSAPYFAEGASEYNHSNAPQQSQHQQTTAKPQWRKEKVLPAPALTPYDEEGYRPSVYASEDNRKQSFVGFPIKNQEFIDRLVKANYIYKGDDDEAVCYKCGCGFKEWKLTDDPKAMHDDEYRDCQ